MRLCPACDQPVAEEITICPLCGNEIGEGRKYIDDYRIVDVLHESHASFLCRAIRQRTNEHVMIRLFTPQSGITDEAASRLKREIEALKKLPDAGFVRHYAIRRAPDGLWYRISEWVDSESWGSLLAAGRLSDRRLLFDLFLQMATAITALHREGYFIPHLTLNDIIALNDGCGNLEIKIDYKLSRFFDPKLDRPDPMLKRLLDSHPDITHERPLDYRSDIWSLGKVFVELLSADLECTDFPAKIETLQLPDEAEVLLKVMLADDPDMRPRSMDDVAASLNRIRAKSIETAVPPAEISPAPPGPIKRHRKRTFLLAAAGVCLAIVGVLSLFQFNRQRHAVAPFETFANAYAPSVAFVLVEYWLKSDDIEYYRNLAEGTAFLVDNDGYLLTSRHVACPWLEDNQFLATAQKLLRTDIVPQFDYRLFLWFEKQKAFNRAARMLETSELTDLYLLDAAFSSKSSPRVFVAGVPKPPVRTRQVMTSPLKDDFAFLKIDQVPDGLAPLPLDSEMISQNIPKLSRFITLGFPLGARTQADAINVSVTSGHVRRSFENVLQVDASLYGGNSGGPVIDMRGNVIGIVSGVAMDWSKGFAPAATPRWDIGLVLPITKTVAFIKELKAGQAKWNGELDFSVEANLKNIKEKARSGRWADAQSLAVEKLTDSPQPELAMGAGMIHFCAGDHQGAQRFLLQSLSMDNENTVTKLMLYLVDWLGSQKEKRSFRTELLALDWRSSSEFQGYLVSVLEGLVDEVKALDGWYSRSEKIWLNYAVALMRSRQGDWPGAENRLRKAVQLGETDGWEFFLARSELEKIQKRRRETLDNEALLAKYNADVTAFEAHVREALSENKVREEKLVRLRNQLAAKDGSLDEKVTVLEKLHGLYPENREILMGLAFYNAAQEAWPQALEYIGRLVNGGGRPYGERMSLELLEAGILHYQGKDDAAQAGLKAFLRFTKDPWYQTICEYLLGKRTEDFLKKQAAKSPENLITASTALGFWSEGSGEKDKAIRYYNEALGTFLDTWREYDFAKERLKRLKKR